MSSLEGPSHLLCCKAGHWKALNFSIVVHTWEASLLGPLQFFPNLHSDNLPSSFPAFAIYTGFFCIFQSFCGCGIGCWLSCLVLHYNILGMNPLMFPIPRGCSKTWDSSVYIATDQKGIMRSRSKRNIMDLFEYFVKWWCNVVEVPTALMPGVLKFFLPQLQSRKSVPSKLYEHIFMSFGFIRQCHCSLQADIWSFLCHLALDWLFHFVICIYIQGLQYWVLLMESEREICMSWQVSVQLFV